MKRWIARLVGLTATAALLAVGFAVIAALLPAPSAPATARSLFASVQDESGSAGDLLDDVGECVPRARANRTWRCEVPDRDGSGGATYRVQVPAGGSCWTARLTRDDSEGGMPPTVRGCVRRPRWSPLDLI